MGASLHGNPVLAKPTPSVSDGFQVPRLVRNQGIRLGAAVAGQAVSAGGALVTARGVSLRSQSGSVRRYEPVRKSQLRAKGLKPQKGVSYLPESDRKVNRWHEKRLNQKAKTPRRPGLIRIRMGSTMMVAGRLLPVLAVGYIAYEYLPDDSSLRDPETVEGHLVGGVRKNLEMYAGFAADVYTGSRIWYALGKGLLGVSS